MERGEEEGERFVKKNKGMLTMRISSTVSINHSGLCIDDKGCFQ